MQTLTDATPSDGTSRVDNARYAYYLAAAFSYTDFSTTGTDMRVYGCTIEVE